METQELARKFAIKNAFDYGKAVPGPIAGKLMGAIKGADIKEVSMTAQEASDWANSLSKEDLAKEYSKYSGDFASEKKEKTERTAKPKMELPGAQQGNFHTRFAPEPSGYPHIGHAKAAFLASSFAELYKGKISLYFDDTNPEKEKKEYVDAIKDGMGWLGITFSDEYYASDNLGKIYECAEQLIDKGNAYACTCAPEVMKDLRLKGKPCIHRSEDPQEHLIMFEEMLAGEFDEGEVVIRFKGKMDSDNTALRDPTILRVKKGSHYRQGTAYCVWPLYDFNTPINDSLHGITDAIRDKNYELRGELYDMILDALGMRKPRVHVDARLAIKNNITSKREQHIYIEQGQLSGFDDPRLPTLSALKRRGIKPAAIKEFVLRFGMSRTEATVDLSMLLDENKKLIDPEAKRLYYVEDPVKIFVVGEKGQEVSLRLHPTADMGTRSYKVENTFYISASDAKLAVPGAIIRLKGLYTIRVFKNENGMISCEPFSGDASLNVQWVSESNFIPCSVLLPKPPLDPNGEFDPESLQTSKGYLESYGANLNEGDIVQFERFGFCILDNKKESTFILCSK